MDDIARLRRFNRSVTQRLGALREAYLGRGRSLGASRLLYEIGVDGCELRALRERLELDSGYASRLIQGLEREGLVEVVASARDARARRLQLTRAGRRELARLDRASDAMAASVLDALAPAEREAFLSALDTVERGYALSSLRLAIEDPGSRDATECLARYYAELAERFPAGFDPAHSLPAEPDDLRLPAGCLLVARLGGRPVGCGALKLEGRDAQVKRMWVSPTERGLGLGARILARLEALAREHGATRLRLETHGTLREAQALYRRAGFVEVPRFNDEPYADHWFEKRLARPRAAHRSR